LLTIFSIPKSFDGDAGPIQWNAIRSWAAIPGARVVLLGDEAGVAEAAAALAAAHVGGIATNEHGTPRLDDAFARLEETADESVRCFVNADIILYEDMVPAVGAVRAWREQFLVVGRTTDLEVGEDVRDPADRARLRDRARVEGRSRGATAIDYFVFTPGLFGEIPPFVVGRARFDNWLVWRARARGVVVDASDAISAIHQHHDYGHIEGGQEAAHFGVEADRNLQLAGGKSRLFTIHDASHVLGPDLRVRRNVGGMLRIRENVRKAAWKLSRR
jgi:hypothetical protein